MIRLAGKASLPIAVAAVPDAPRRRPPRRRCSAASRPTSGACCATAARVDIARLVEEVGFRPRFDAVAAVEDYVRTQGGRRIVADAAPAVGAVSPRAVTRAARRARRAGPRARRRRGGAAARAAAGGTAPFPVGPALALPAPPARGDRGRLRPGSARWRGAVGGLPARRARGPRRARMRRARRRLPRGRVGLRRGVRRGGLPVPRVHVRALVARRGRGRAQRAVRTAARCSSRTTRGSCPWDAT